MPLRGDDEEELLDVDCKIEGQEMMEKCFYPDESRQKSRTLLFFSLSSSSKKNGFRMLVRIRTRKNGNIPLFCRKTGRKRRVFFQKEEEIGILTSIAGNKKGIFMPLFALFQFHIGKEQQENFKSSKNE